MLTVTTLAILSTTLGGICIGLASWLLLAALGRVAGVSSIAANLIAPDKVTDPHNVKEPHEAKAPENTDSGWRLVFVLGLVVGGLIAAQFFPAPALATRPLWVLIAGGLLVGVGTVVGSGCTSGHGVCGLGRRSVRSLAAVVTFMAVGMAVVAVIVAATGKPTL